MFFKITVLKKFANFAGTHVSESSLIKLQALKTATKKRLQNRFFPVKFAKFLKTPLFTEHLHWLLLTVSSFQPATLLKKRLRQRCFSVCKIFNNIF